MSVAKGTEVKAIAELVLVVTAPHLCRIGANAAHASAGSQCCALGASCDVAIGLSEAGLANQAGLSPAYLSASVGAPQVELQVPYTLSHPGFVVQLGW